jgi:RNA polymerase sigma-70 factor, ECF subfamily
MWRYVGDHPGSAGGRSRDASACASVAIMTVDSPANCAGDGARAPDAESAQWVRALSGCGAERDRAVTALHEALLRVARAEFARRSGQLRISGPELDDLAYQATADAVIAILAKVGQFRGESRFTTWAYRFVILEVSAKIGRHFWRQPHVPLDTADWDRLPDRLGLDPARESEWRDLARALRRAVEGELTDHQRRIFIALVVDGVPLDALVARLGTSRNAIYKTMYDARGKLRASLVANGYLHESR